MIRVQNIYYMLAYAFQTLNSREAGKLDAEKFDHADDLFAAILAGGIGKQIKQGLGQDYTLQTEERMSPKGKICLAETFKRQSGLSRLTVCQVDNYTQNTCMNQILKAVSRLLLRSDTVKPENKQKLKRLLLYFGEVDDIELSTIRWGNLKYSRINKSYKMLMNICYLIVEGMLMSEADGSYRLTEYIQDEKMSALFERFIISYYRRHYPSLDKIAASCIEWDTDDGIIQLLPQMRTDIMLEQKGATLIIDAKYYQDSLQTGRYGNKTIRSGHLYQIFTYVKNKDLLSDGSVSGLLLYAGTEEDSPDMEYQLSGNKISAKSLDLNCDFIRVQEQLDQIINQWLSENSLECPRMP